MPDFRCLFTTVRQSLLTEDGQDHFGIIPLQEYNGPMPWRVEHTDQFKEWWDTLSDEQQEDLAATWNC